MNPKRTAAGAAGLRLRLRVLVMILALTASSCSPTPTPAPNPAPELSTIFGGNGFSIDNTCAHAMQYETASSAGCLEGYEILPSDVRVFVRANPPSSYQVTVLACSSIQSCPEVALTFEDKETPAPEASAGTMTRFSFLLSRPLNSSVNRICARQDTLLPVLPNPQNGPPTPELQNALLGCMPFRENLGPAGAFGVRIAKEGVIVEGWILDPVTDGPVQVEVRRTNDSASVTADRPDTRSQARWPRFSTNHGFQAVLPFVGRGGGQSVCLAVPGWSTPAGSDELGCAQYTESATFYLEERAYNVGDKIPFTAEMLDPGARLRLNLFTAGNFFLLPWKDADLATIVADSHGHAEGAIPTDLIPPGAYRLSFLCESGCSEVDEVPNVTGVLDDGKSYLVALGPAFSVLSGTAASVSVTPSSTGGSLLVEGRDLPPSTPVEVVLLFGLYFADGLHVAESTQVVVGNDGRISATIAAAGLPSGKHLVYVVADHDHVLASATVDK